jgi:hypothetical protein
MKTLEEAAENNKKIEDYYIGKTLKLKKTIPSRYYETTLQESETIKIDKFVDGDVEGCRVAIGYKDGFEFLLFNTTHAESYLQGLYSLIDEPTITQKEPKQVIIIGDGLFKQETLEEAAGRYVEEDNCNRYYNDFIAGANWQAERMYSEKEVKQIIEATLIEYSDFVLADIPEWFEQFKKK